MKTTIHTTILLTLASLALAEPRSEQKPTPYPPSEDTPEQAKPETAATSNNESAAPEPTGHPFSWPFLGWEEMTPRGGTTKGPQVTLATEPCPAFQRVHQPGLDAIERDRRAILALAGDFRVSFDFIETAASAFPHTPPQPYFSWGTERAFVIEDRPGFISIQHILVMEFVGEDGETHGPHIVKHWRQDWTHEATRHIQYQGNRTWASKETTPSPGTWTQTVWQVDDSPRYSVTGTWDHEGGLSIFTTGDSWRPLPRREFSVRDDYNVLAGHHQITLTPSGWLHNQYNRKIIVQDGRLEQTLATELGAARYQRITSPCLEPATTYWESTAPLWKDIRQTWADLFATDTTITLRRRIDEKPMHAHLFQIAAEFQENPNHQLTTQAETLITRFIKTP